MKTTSLRIMGALVGLSVVWMSVPRVQADDTTDYLKQITQYQNEIWQNTVRQQEELRNWAVQQQQDIEQNRQFMDSLRANPATQVWQQSPVGQSGTSKAVPVFVPQPRALVPSPMAIAPAVPAVGPAQAAPHLVPKPLALDFRGLAVGVGLLQMGPYFSAILVAVVMAAVVLVILDAVSQTPVLKLWSR